MQHEKIFLLSFHFTVFQPLLLETEIKSSFMKKPYKKWNDNKNGVLYSSFHFLMQETGFSKNGSFLETVLWKMLICSFAI